MAGGVCSSLAITTLIARNMVGNKDSVANFEGFNFAADLINDAGGFMTQHNWGFRHTIPFYNVATANPARHNFQQRFVLADLGDGNVLDSDVMVVVVDGGLHQFHQEMV